MCVALLPVDNNQVFVLIEERVAGLDVHVERVCLEVDMVNGADQLVAPFRFLGERDGLLRVDNFAKQTIFK